MTSPIALILPISGAEPVPQPAVVEDPALFAAALVAALQAALVQPQVAAPVSSATPAAPSTPQGEGRGADGQAGEADPSGAGAGARAETSGTAVGTATTARTPRDRGQRLTAASAVKSASTAVVTAGPRISVKDAVRAAKSAGTTLAPVGAASKNATRSIESLPTAKAGKMGAAGLSTNPPDPNAGTTNPTESTLSSPQQARTPVTEVAIVATASDPQREPTDTVASDSTPPTLGVIVTGSAPAGQAVEATTVEATTVETAGMAPASERTAPSGQPMVTSTVRSPLDGRTAQHVQEVLQDTTRANPASRAESFVNAPAADAGTVVRVELVPRVVTPAATVSSPEANPVEMPTSSDGARATELPANAPRVDSAESSRVNGPVRQAEPSPAEEPAVAGPDLPRVSAPSNRMVARPVSGEPRSLRRRGEAPADTGNSGVARDAASLATPLPSIEAAAVSVQFPAPKAELPAPKPGDTEPESGSSQRWSVTALAREELSGDAPSGAGQAPQAAGSGRGLAFAQELAALLGDAEIADLRVQVGPRGRVAARGVEAKPPLAEDRASGPVESVPPSPPIPNPGATPPGLSALITNRPDRDAPAVPLPSGAAHGTVAPVVDDDLLVSGAGATPLPSAAVGGAREPSVEVRPTPVPRRASDREDGAGAGEPRESVRTTSESVRVRVAEPVLQRAAPLALPLDVPAPTRSVAASRAPILPASRQELPAPANRDGESAPATRRDDAGDTSEPSDSQSRASTAVPTQSESPSRGEPRSKELSGAEARNMPDRAETKDRPAGLADRVTLQVADAEGRQTRIRVTVLGDQVRAVILPSDQESARLLERRMDDLQAALVRQGFADPKVSVQSPGSSATQAAWGAASGGTQTENASGRGTDQPAEDRGHGSGRQNQERGGDGQRHPQQRFRERDPDDRQNQDA